MCLESRVGMIEMMDLILILIATGIGFSFAWIIANNNKQTNGVDIPDMEGIFSKLSTEALNANNEQFLSLAEQVLKVQQAEGNQELEVKKAQIEGLLKPLSEQIKALENENKAMEIARGKAYVEIKEHVKLMLAQTENLGKETNSLTTALTQSANIRGNWGEISLENIFEMSNLRKDIDYVRQEGQDDGKRPDFIVNIPGGGKVPIDAKATGKKFLESINQESEAERGRLLKEHAKAMRGRVTELKRKEYRDSVSGDVEAVVMFVPSEALLAVTFDFERDLHEFAMKNDILIASPVSLLALLRTIAFQWRQVEQAESTREAIEICRELYKRFAVWSEHYVKVGDNLKNAVNTFNSSVGSFQTKINPQVRKLNGLRLQDDLAKVIKEPKHVEIEVRSLPEPEGLLEEQALD